MSARILTIDLENSAALGYFWGATYNTNIIKVHEPSRVISFAAKWRGEKKVEFRSVHHDGRDEMVARAWALLDEADAVITYNGRRHDTPHFNTEFVRAGLGLPSPYREVDLYAVTKGKLKFQQNRLDYVSQEMGIGKKHDHEGFDLWLKCAAGDAKAWARMRAYNIQDVRLTEAYYELLLPVIPQAMHPNLNLFTDGAEGCPRCGSGDLERRGFAPTTVSLFQRYRCRGCGGWSRGKSAVGSADMRGAA